MTVCESCGVNPATMHLTTVINGEKTEKHLCMECAKKQNAGLPQAFDIGHLLSGFMQHESGSPVSPTQPVSNRCPTCGMEYRQFREGGLLGCADCYTAFSDHLEPLLNRIHGHVRHVGKMPARAGGAYRFRREIERLNAQMHIAIEQEQFEKAAELRDRIRALQAEEEAAGTRKEEQSNG